MAPVGRKEAVLREQLALVHRQTPVVLLGSVLAGSIVALTLLLARPWPAVLLWWLAVLLAAAVRVHYWRQARGLDAAGALQRWRVRLLWGSWLAGLIWGGGAFLLFPPSAVYQLFLAFAVGGMAAGATVTLAYDLPAYFGFVLPATLPLALRFFMEGIGAHTAMGVLVLLFVALLGVAARNQNRSFVRAIELQLDKATLSHELASTLEGLEERVRTRTRELRDANARLRREAVARRRAAAAEREARAEADRANAAKSLFLAAAAHDLRQPLHSMRLSLDVLRRTLSTPQQQELGARLARSLDANQALLDSLLQLSALESGRLQPHLRPVSLRELIETIAAEQRPAAERKGLALRTHPWRRMAVVVETDPTLLERVLRNLLHNAVTYTEHGAVLVGWRVRRQGVRIEVWDTGPGIAEDHLQAVFRDFYRASNAGHGGVGLGLAIVARLVRALGYRIEVRSRPGRGSLFAVTIPVGTGHTAVKQSA